MKAYMGYSREAGSDDGAILIFANNAKEARKIGYTEAMASLGCESWIDFAVCLIKNPQIFSEANDMKIMRGEAHIILEPELCPTCQTWGSVRKGNHCEFCN